MTQQPDPAGGDPREPGIDLSKQRPGAAQQPSAYPPPPPGGWATPPPPGSASGHPAGQPPGQAWGQPSGQPAYGGYPPQQQHGGYPPPQQHGGYPPQQQWQGYPGSRLTPSDERTWAGAAHWSALLASLVVLAFLGPLIVLLVKGNDSPFVRRQAVESLNFQITILIAAAVSFALLFVVIGIVLLPLVGLAWLVFTIIGAVKASSGEDYRYPFSLRMVH
jgi:uncharacterized protein